MDCRAAVLFILLAGDAGRASAGTIFRPIYQYINVSHLMYLQTFLRAQAVHCIIEASMNDPVRFSLEVSESALEL